MMRLRATHVIVCERVCVCVCVCVPVCACWGGGGGGFSALCCRIAKNKCRSICLSFVFIPLPRPSVSQDFYFSLCLLLDACLTVVRGSQCDCAQLHANHDCARACVCVCVCVCVLGILLTAHRCSGNQQTLSAQKHNSCSRTTASSN